MKLDSIAALAEKKIATTDGSLRDFRHTHLELFRKNGLKETTLDSYKFTNMETFLSALTFEPKNFEGIFPDYMTSELPTITFVDGEFTKADKLPKGITLRRINGEFTELKTLLKEHNALSNLHHALLQDGALIEIDKKAELSLPIRITHLITRAGVHAPTHLIKVAPFAKAVIIEETLVLNVEAAAISETHILAGHGSKITHIALDQGAKKSVLHSSVFADVDKDAQVQSFLFHTAGKLSRHNLELNLKSSGASGESYALYLSHGDEQSDINTTINHLAADTTSNQLAKGILDGDSKGIFTGLIHIFPKAQRVSSGQLNKNLLLSNKAQAHSQPQLEIFADDVKCSHGSTTGQLSPDEVFYLQARGIPESRARHLLAFGFALEIVEKIQDQRAKSYISKVVREKLREKFSLGGIA